MTVTATSAEALESIQEAIHDHWMPLGDVSFDRDEVRIPLTDKPLKRASTNSAFPWSLIVHSAESLSVHDEADVGYYDIAEIAYDATRGAVIIQCGVPLRLEIQVRDINISLRTE